MSCRDNGWECSTNQELWHADMVTTYDKDDSFTCKGSICTDLTIVLLYHQVEIWPATKTVIYLNQFVLTFPDPRCGAGEFYNTDNNCEQCAKNSYKDSIGDKDCSPCPADTETESEGASVCIPGTLRFISILNVHWFPV